MVVVVVALSLSLSFLAVVVVVAAVTVVFIFLLLSFPFHISLINIFSLEESTSSVLTVSPSRDYPSFNSRE